MLERGGGSLALTGPGDGTRLSRKSLALTGDVSLGSWATDRQPCGPCASPDLVVSNQTT